jgi:hypothetical protein
MIEIQKGCPHQGNPLVSLFLFTSFVMLFVSFAMRSGIECLKRNRKNSHQQPLPGSLGKTGRAKAGVNIPLSQ